MNEIAKQKLVIIDDEGSQLQRLVTLFSDEYSCFVATSGKIGLQTVFEHADDRPLVICDVKLPDIVGFDVCKTIKSLHPDICVILLTSFNDKTLRMSGLEAYADNYLDKVISDDEMKLLVRNIYNTFYPQHEIDPPCLKANAKNRFDNFELRITTRILDYFHVSDADRELAKVTVEGMAKHFNVTTRTFQRAMEKRIGVSYSQYFADIRLKRGRELLATNFTVTEVAEILGFSSPSHFSREFKKRFGLTPNKYKQGVRSLLPMP